MDQVSSLHSPVALEEAQLAPERKVYLLDMNRNQNTVLTAPIKFACIKLSGVYKNLPILQQKTLSHPLFHYSQGEGKKRHSLAQCLILHVNIIQLSILKCLSAEEINSSTLMVILN